MAGDYNKEDLIKKVEAGKKLTREEELFYLTKVQHFTTQEAENIMAIAANDSKTTIID